MEVFWERSYEGASINDLAHAMGINPPSLYAAFGSKEALFREAVGLYTTREGSATQRALTTAPTARAAVERMLRDNVDMFTDPAHPPGCLVVLSATSWAPKNASVRAYLAELRRHNVQTLRDRLQQGISDGELASDTDVDALAAYYHTLLEGLSVQARDGTSRHTLHAIIDHALASWHNSAKAKRSGSQGRVAR